MSEYQASRTLVKSPPELWAECSDARSLARHLGEDVGEIRIRRLEPETTVAWEGERISGTVRLEPSGWGTKVTLTAAPSEVAVEQPGPVQAEEPDQAKAEKPAPVQADEPDPAQAEKPEPVATAQPEPVQAEPEPSPAPKPVAAAQEPARKGFGARFRRLFGSRPVSVQSAAPVVVDPPTPAADPAPIEPPAPESVVVEAPKPEPAPAAQPPAKALPPERRTDPVDLTAALDSLGKAHHRPFSRA